MDFFAPYMDRITALCKAHKVKSLYAFGSAVRGGMNLESDVDLLFELNVEDPYEFADTTWSLEERFGRLFKRPVDLVSKRALRNRFFIDAVELEKVKLYEA